ncbi:MAG: hypothetical protein IJ599_01605 [Alphaproteobacteria bacterium]|nr:hypothetical protein [Alphaproteobacteria bacterium]
MFADFISASGVQSLLFFQKAGRIVPICSFASRQATLRLPACFPGSALQA